MNEFEKNPSKVIINYIYALSDHVNAIKSEIRTFEENFNRLYTLVSRIDRDGLYAKKNRLLTRFMNKFVSSGLTTDQAAVLTASRIHDNVTRILAVYDHIQNYDKVRKRESMLFLVKKLKAAKFSATQIAKITGYHEKYIYKLVRTPKTKK